VTARFLHVSDLHFGAGRDAELEVGLSRLLENLDLELIVASGDLTSPERALRAKRGFAGGVRDLKAP
jgi:predicted MPP superfamily phosphohydrolase